MFFGLTMIPPMMMVMNMERPKERHGRTVLFYFCCCCCCCFVDIQQETQPDCIYLHQKRSLSTTEQWWFAIHVRPIYVVMIFCVYWYVTSAWHSSYFACMCDVLRAGTYYVPDTRAMPVRKEWGCSHTYLPRLFVFSLNFWSSWKRFFVSFFFGANDVLQTTLP